MVVVLPWSGKGLLAKTYHINSVDLIGIPTPCRLNTALTPDLDRQFQALRRWSDTPSPPSSLKSESDSPTQLESQVIDSLSQTVPFTSLPRRPPSPDPFVEESASVCSFEEFAVPELAVPVRSIENQDLLKRCHKNKMAICTGRDLFACEVPVVDEEVIESPQKGQDCSQPEARVVGQSAS